MKPLFEYLDYRKFLATYYDQKKKSTRAFSYRYFAQKAKIHSPSFLKHVIDGKRNLTRPMIENFCTGLDLNDKESRYFRNLVLFNQAKTSSEKQEYYTNLKEMFGAVEESVLGVAQFDYFANWFTSIIRELICSFDFKDDYKKIAEMLIPQILPSEAKKAVKLLLHLKLISRQPDGTYLQTSTAIVAENEIMTLAMRTFSKAMLEHSKNAIELFSWKERHISGLTIGISPETYDVLSAEIEAFKDRVKLIVNRDEESETVYQMNISLFPVTRNIRTLESDKAVST